MSDDSNNPDSAPSPEQLAAYVDGELDPAARLRVEAWLKADPATRDAIDGHRRLARHWEAARPPQPNAAAWTATFARTEARCTPLSRRRGLPRTLWLSAGAAAAVLAALMVGRVFLYPDRPAPSHPPLAHVVPGSSGAEDILLASQDDISIINVEPFQDDDMAPSIGEGEVPMIVAPRIPRAGVREP